MGLEIKREELDQVPLTQLPREELLSRATTFRRLAFERSAELRRRYDEINALIAERKADVESFAKDVQKLNDQIEKLTYELDQAQYQLREQALTTVKIEAQRDALTEVVRMNIQAAHCLPIKPEVECPSK